MPIKNIRTEKTPNGITPAKFKAKWGLKTWQLAHVMRFASERTLEKRMGTENRASATGTEIAYLAVYDWYWERLREWFHNHDRQPNSRWIHPRIVEMYVTYVKR